jgi:hypothetical protein
MKILTDFFPQHVEDVERATGRTEIREDFISNLSRILKLTSNYLLSSMLQDMI